MKRTSDSIWQELYSYEGEVYGFIKNTVGDGDVARDLYQDVYLSVLLNLENLDPNRSIKNWLYTVTRNRVINYLRSHRRREFELIDDSRLREKLNQQSDDDLVNHILVQLPPRLRKILILREKEGWNYQALAKKMNLSQAAATSLLKRAREAFQKNYLMQFLPDWFTRSARSIALKDVFRFINPFNPPLNLVEIIDRKCHQYFSGIQLKWDKIRETFIQTEQLKEMLQHQIGVQHHTILDCGAGTGTVSRYLAEMGHTLLAIDILPEMIRILHDVRNRYGLETINPIQADIRQLPIKWKTIDIILYIFILHHLPAPLDLILHSRKLLKKSGKIVIVDFLRHDNTSLADEMGDLWMGFDPSMLIKHFKKNDLKHVSQDIFSEDKDLKSFCLVFEHTS
jgi:RNA polymerase sigma-70 factor (ECF subfamily)